MRVTFVHLGREHLGIEYLSAVLKEQGHEVSMAYDPGLFGLNDNVFYIPRLERLFDRKDLLLRDLESSSPHVAAFSVYTGTYGWALGVAREVKERLGIPTVFGGIHATLVPEELAQRPEVDYVVVGEAEEAFVELLERLEAGRAPEKVRNVWYRSGENVVANPVRPPIRDLDRLPPPDKSLFEEEVDYGDDYIVLAARGCPFRCTYCCESYWNRLYGGAYFRRRSVDSVISELSRMREKYEFREVMFNDPIFFTDRNWLEDLMERYRAEINVPFRCFGKVGLLDEEVAEWLRFGGCYAVEFGLQTLNPHVRADVLGRRETNAEYERAFRVLDRAGIRYDIDHMFGLPGETVEDHEAAARFYGSLRRLNRIKPHNLSYFPKLEIVRKARDAGMLGVEDESRINRGEMPSDFFHRDALREDALKSVVWDFQTFYRLLPIIPGFLIENILRDGRWRNLRKIPSPLIVLGQVLVALRGRDYRFPLYFRYYLLRLRRSIQRLRRPRALLRAAVFGCCALATVPIGNRLLDWGAFHAGGLLLGGLALWWAASTLWGKRSP